MILYRMIAGNEKLEVQFNDKQVIKSVLNITEKHNQASKMTK